MKQDETDLTRINFEDDRFRISYLFDLERLKRSVAESGLLSPIVVTPRDKNIVIVTGWRRALACRDLSLSAIPCYIFEEPEDLKAFQLAILENSATRDFNILELAVILKKLKAFGLEEKSLLETYLPLFGIPQTMAHLDTYLALAGFDADTKEFIYLKKVSYPVVQHLMELEISERAVLLPHLRHLGQNKQKELLEFLLETSKRDNIPVHEILATETIDNIVQSAELSPPQKADKIRLLMRKRRYPFLSKQEDAFVSSLKKMDWPEDIAIHHSPFFEREDLAVHFTFKNSAEFKHKVQLLQEISSTNRISELFETMSND